MILWIGNAIMRLSVGGTAPLRPVATKRTLPLRYHAKWSHLHMDRRFVACFALFGCGGDFAHCCRAAEKPPGEGRHHRAPGPASFDAPENTVSSVKLAWEQEADGAEFDIYLTKDGKIVVSHDDDTKRTAGIKKHIAKTTLAELRNARCRDLERSEICRRKRSRPWGVKCWRQSRRVRRSTLK